MTKSRPSSPEKKERQTQSATSHKVIFAYRRSNSWFAKIVLIADTFLRTYIIEGKSAILLIPPPPNSNLASTVVLICLVLGAGI